MRKILYIILSAILVACEPTLVAEFEDRPVVCCYLEDGCTPTLEVKKLIAFRDDAVYSSQDLDQLSVTITDQTSGTEYILSPTGDGLYENPSFIPQTGHGYSLSFVYNDFQIYSETTIPEAPDSVSFSTTYIGVMDHGSSPNALSKADPGQTLEITWYNPLGEYFIIEGLTESDTPIQYSSTRPDKSFQLDYTRGSSANVMSSEFGYVGDYYISVMKIHQEYAVYSQGSDNSSSNLEDIRGNVDGGYGIFSGFSRVTQTVKIYKQSSPF